NMAMVKSRRAATRSASVRCLSMFVIIVLGLWAEGQTVRGAESLSWTASPCGGQQACTDMNVSPDGGGGSNLLSGQFDWSENDDCQDHAVRFTSNNCVCPGANPADDFYPLDAESKDPEEGADEGVSCCKGASLGDSCGSNPRKTFEVTVPSRCEPKGG